jgi:hypothetical protein
LQIDAKGLAEVKKFCNLAGPHLISSKLADLDELILHCRDDRAKSYIIEATNCYHAGAYRAAIVSAWVAICFDFIDKLQELSLAGDKGAEELVKGIEIARRANDFASSLKFERELLELARDKFELISHLEFIDLARLQEDRNRCAHPSLVSDGQAFLPSAELARLHIRNAVTHFLQHPPVQGKYALERLLEDVKSDYFPTSVKTATASLASGPMKRPRDALIRNFVVVLLKVIFVGNENFAFRARAYGALGAVRNLHAKIFDAVLAEKLSSLLEALPDAGLSRAIRFLEEIEDSWRHLVPGVQHRLENFVSNLPSGEMVWIDSAISIKPLYGCAVKRLARTTRDEIKSAALLELPPEIADRYIDLYLSSKNYSEANEWAKEISLYAPYFDALQQKRILEGAAKNTEIMHSNGLIFVIKKLRQTERLPIHDFERTLKECGFTEAT